MSVGTQAIDVAIIGGGLHGCLVALALARWRPEARLVIIDAQDRFGGGAIAPFWLERVSAAASRAIDPVIVGEWPRYYVDTGIDTASVTKALALVDPAQLHAELCMQLRAEHCWRNMIATPCGERSVATPRGEIQAGLVLDLRPPPPAHGPAILATTIEYRSDDPLGLRFPILLDHALVARSGADVWQHFPIGGHAVLARALRFDASPLSMPARFTVTTNRAPREVAIPFAADPRWPSLPPHPLLPSAMGSAVALVQAIVALPEWTPAAYAEARANAAAAIAPAVAAREALLTTLRDVPERRSALLANLALGVKA